MKKLSGKHIFQMAKIIKAANLKEELAGILSNTKSDSNPEKIGVELITTIFSACGDDKVEQRICELFDDVFETKVADMSIESIITSFNQLARENNLMNFFKSAGLSK